MSTIILFQHRGCLEQFYFSTEDVYNNSILAQKMSRIILVHHRDCQQ
jgi:hypothetical protein